MCGIAGIIFPDTSLAHQQRLQQMANSMLHRGPDGEGYWINENNTVGFAHRRLSIIDLSSAAAQPMHCLHYTIIFNGEIYNYIELKDKLQKKGYAFTTQSDTEIIPAAFDCWGMECLDKFDGMFAFALYDKKKQEVFLARDRFGEKPLYYHADYFERGKFGQFIFASEMKALWAAGLPKQLNGTMMLNYITNGYTQNPIKKTETFYSNILSLPPGHYLIINPAGKKMQMRKWYDMNGEVRSKEYGVKSENEAIEQFQNLFFTSVERRLRSDVSVGTSLSGGLDSSSIVAAIHQQKNISAQWKNVCFTATFPGFEKDESLYSKQVADHFSISQYIVAPNENDWIKYFDRLMYYQEEPLQSSSVLTQFMIYQLAKEKNITVLLDGQGADEILAGYPKYIHWYLQQLLRTDKSVFIKEKKILKQNQFLENWGFKNYAAAYFPEKTAKYLLDKAFRQIRNHKYLNDEFTLKYKNKDSFVKPVVKNVEDILYYNTFNFGLGELLRYADRNSMAHSREVRLPFLNHQLVEFIFSLPSSFKIQNGFTKWILRKSMDNFLPEQIVWRKGKIGYEPPQKKWMLHEQIREMIMEARKKLVHEHVLDKKILQQPVHSKTAHDKDNFDWRYLCAAKIFTPNP